MGKLHIFGCGGHARSVADIYLNLYPKEELLFIDTNAIIGEHIFTFPVVKEVLLDIRQESVFVAIGDNRLRKTFFDKHITCNILSIISKSAYIGLNALIKRGCFVGNFCHIGPDVVINEDTIINNGAIIEHEVKIGKHCHIAPNAIISGRTVLDNEVFVGAGATIIDKIKICSQVIIGAGSTVISHIDEPGTYVGNPARKIKK